MRHNGRLLFLLFAMQMGVAVGCSHNPSSDPDIPSVVKIGRLVSDMDDFAQTPRELKIAVPRLFAPGSEPSEKDLPRYADYHYEGKPPVLNGDTATVVVIVKDAKTGNSVGELTWSVKKVKDAKRVFEPSDSASAKGQASAHGDKAAKEIWKLTDAPLPAK